MLGRYSHLPLILCLIATWPLAMVAQTRGVVGESYGQLQQFSRASPVLNVQQVNGPPVPSVTGTVRDAVSGSPIGNAVVMLNGIRANSAQDGSFELKNVPSGMGYLNAQKPGYFPPKAGPPTAVKIDTSNTKFEVKLVSGGVIHGRVVTSDGDPIAGITVTLIRSQIMSGTRARIPAGGTSTDQNGNYEFDAQQPGPYWLHIAQRPVYPGFTGVVVNGARLAELYPAVFYPNAADVESAQMLQVTSGAETQADFSLTAVPAYKIAGKIAGAQRAQVACEAADDSARMGGSMTRNGGEFTLSQVPAGACHLTVDDLGSAEHMHGEQTVNVANADITNVVIALSPVPVIPIQVNAPAGKSTANVMLQQDGQAPGGRFGGRNMPGARQESTPDGQRIWKIVNAKPGHYRLTVQAPNACVDSINYGGADVVHDGLVIPEGAGEQPVVVSLRDDCASLAVKPSGSLVPTDGSAKMVTTLLKNAADQVTVLNCDAQSTCSFANLTPGPYKLYLLDDVSNLEYQRPEALRDLASRDIALAPNDKQSINVDLQHVGETAP